MKIIYKHKSIYADKNRIISESDYNSLLEEDKKDYKAIEIQEARRRFTA
jgi:hypothetical protein